MPLLPSEAVFSELNRTTQNCLVTTSKICTDWP